MSRSSLSPPTVTGPHPVSGKTPSPLAILSKLLKLDLQQVSKEIGSIAPFLIPFVKMACVYFVLDLPEEEPSPTAAFVKALPVLSLAWLVCLHGVRYGGNAPSTYVDYNRSILYGLLFSIAGDIFLIWQQKKIYFILGMICFTCTQISYIRAFGLKPFGLKEFIPSLLVLIVSLSVIIPCVQDTLMMYFVIIYAILLCIMGWRSLACFTMSGDIPWKKILSAVGAFFFVVSDVLLAFNKFCHAVPFQRTLIMSTYYAAQLCISLSVVNFHLTARRHSMYYSRLVRLSDASRMDEPRGSDFSFVAEDSLPVRKRVSSPVFRGELSHKAGMKINQSDAQISRLDADAGEASGK